MGPVGFLLLLVPSVLRAQVNTEFSSGVMVEMDNSTDSLTNSTRTSGMPSVPSNPSKTSGFVVTPSEEDDWSTAETFLYSGDPSDVEGARCSRPYSPPGKHGPLPKTFSDPLRPALDALANTANFLNMIFQASDLRESTVQEDMEWYHALVRALLEADILIQRALLTFDADPTAPVPQLVLCATRNLTAKVQTVVLQDLSKAWESLHPPIPAPDDSWFSSFKFPPSNQPPAVLSKRVLLNDLSTLETPKWAHGDGYVTNRSGVRWASAPFLDCKDTRFVPGWQLTLSTSFYGLKPDLTPEFRGVIRVDVRIQDIDVNQCAAGDSWFADTHQCNRTSMECVPIPGRGFRLGQYCCHCKQGYYNPGMAAQDYDGDSVNASDGDRTCFPIMPVCLPCWPGCASCQDATPCSVQEDWFLRSSVLTVQGIFMLLTFVSMLAAYCHRQNRRIRASGLMLLETILFGSLLLYFPVFIMYFKPSTFRCILLRWVRMLGFFIVYGTITLKMYRVLKVFLSRTAQRAPYMSSLHLLRILGVMLLTVSWFLCAWTVAVLQNRDRNIPIFITSTTTDGQGFNACYLDRWDYMMAVAELLFLCWGSSLWTAVRPVPSAFHEPRYMGIAIHNELLLSLMFHLLRFTFPHLHPDWMLLLSFIHTHLTITMTLALIFIPKFLSVSVPVKETIAAEVYEDEVDLRRSGSCLNSSFRSVWSDHSTAADDLRDELKKLYTQLEIHKTKKMTANNPHLSKKRSSRCTLGRSLIQRIAEIPESMSRRCSRDDREGSMFSRRVSQCDSYKAPDTISISYRSSVKSPSPVMRKSQSDHHYIREQESSVRDSLLRANSVKRSSQRSETDSLDITPGVCKSVSAQNLTIDTNLLHPDHTRLHKSLSLTSTNAHTMEHIPKVNRANTVRSRSKQSISISDQIMSALHSESFDKAEVCPWEVAREQLVDKNQKHVTYAPSQDDESTGPPAIALICPWDHLPAVERKQSGEKGTEAECESPKLQAPVSASAPGSPRPKVTKDQRVFSFHNSNKWLSVKAITRMASVDTGSKDKSNKERHFSKEDSISQKSKESASTMFRSTTVGRNRSIEKKTIQKRSWTTTEGKPCLVKQQAIRLSSGDSSDRSPIRLRIGKSVIYPGDVEDIQKDGTYENVVLSRQNSKRSSICSWDTLSSSSRTPSTHRRGSYRITQDRNVSHTDAGPRDGTGSLLKAEGSNTQQCLAAGVYLREWQEKGNVKEQETAHAGAHPLESQDGISKPALAKDAQMEQPVKFAIEICPWESEETPRSSKTQDNDYANICPWDVSNKTEAVYENLTPSDKGSLMVPTRQENMKAALYPSVSKEISSNKQQNFEKTTALRLAGSKTKGSESCPWDFPDPPNITEVICPWEQNVTDESVTKMNTVSQTTIKITICPWEAEDKDKSENLPTTAFPLEVATKTQMKTNLALPNVCPWDMVEAESVKSEASKGPENLQKQSNLAKDICPWETTNVAKLQDIPESIRDDVCPWETKELKVIPHKERSIRPDVCPWEKEKPVGLQKKDSIRSYVCPWDAEEPQGVPKKDSILSGVCSQVKESPKAITKKHNTRSDICPWNAEETKCSSKRDSIQSGVCPWESEEPKGVQKRDGNQSSICSQVKYSPKVFQKKDVCPWESEDPKDAQEGKSIRSDVCPWESEDPKDAQEGESIQSDVCPWESEDPKDAQEGESIQSDVCPWESEGSQKKDIIRSNISSQVKDSPKIQNKDICPWDSEEPNGVQKRERIQSDTCPWESEDPKHAQKKDGSWADVCPWDSEDPKNVQKKDSIRSNISSQVKDSSKIHNKDICPWDSEEPNGVQNKDGICQQPDVQIWETQEPGVIKNQDHTDRENPQKSAEIMVDMSSTDQKGVTENQESVNVGAAAADISTQLCVDGDFKSNVTLSRRDALCSWEMIRSRSSSFTDNVSDVFMWEPENIPEEDEDDDAECAAEALIFPPDL
ncbi:probable G-protein coupled receptor 179 [Thalassophryne amazonica]|uniref:probable G-protein coupled receptor 179 n=1 Tax=Thalassophryne amazonica TaxID=390379 RepID=UPI0014725237|nr:probable G-protein coupled receptor 179 [Thalassophryne amazonica]